MKNSNIIKKYLSQISIVIKDLLFVIGNERPPAPGPVIIAFRNYLPRSINRHLIIKMLIRQGFLRPIAEELTDFYLTHKPYKRTIEVITRDPILRFLTKVNNLYFGGTASDIKGEILRMSNPNEPYKVVSGTREEQEEELRRLLKEIREKGNQQ